MSGFSSRDGLRRPSLEPDDLLTRAEEMRRRGDAQAALKALGTFIEQQPDHLAARILAAELCEALGRWNDALAHVEHVLAREPGHDAAVSRFERIAEKSGNAAAAVALWDRLVDASPDRFDYRLRRETLRLRGGDERAAYAAIVALAKNHPQEPELALQAGLAARCLERAPEALRWLLIAQRSHPDLERVLLAIAREHCDLEHFADAERALAQIPSVMRESRELLELRLDVLARRDFAAARSRFATAIAAQDKRDSLIALARLGLRFGFDREAIDALQAFVPKGTPKITLALARCLIHAGAHAQAKEILSSFETASLDRDELEDLVEVARELCDRPLLDAALERRQAMDASAVIVDAAKAISTVPSDRKRARLARASGETAECLQILEPLIAGDAPVALQDARLYLRALIDAEEIDRAWAVYRRFEGDFAERELVELQADLLRSDLRLDESLDCLRRAVQRDPLDETFALRLADALIARGDGVAAQPIIDAWSAKRPAALHWLHKRLNAAMASHHDWPAVMAAWQQAFARASPKSRMTLSFEHARVARMAADLSKADAELDALRAALDTSVLDQRTRLRLQMECAHELTWLGRNAEARVIFDRLLALPMPIAERDDLCRRACANEAFGGGDFAHYLELRNRLARSRHHLTVTPFATAPENAAPPLRVVALLHLFHQEQWPEFRDRLAALRGCAPQLIVSIPQNADADACIADIEAFDPAAKIVRIANRGFDIGGHWQLLDAIDVRNFDVAVLLQTKKSTHTRVGHVWRRNLVDALIGTRSRWLDNLRVFATEPRVGMLGSAWHQTTFHPWTYPAMGEVLRALEMPTRFEAIKPIHEFTAGSMFMIRAGLLAEIHAKTRDTIAFEPYESLSVARRADESLAHAMERAFGLYTRWRGCEIVWRP